MAISFKKVYFAIIEFILILPILLLVGILFVSNKMGIWLLILPLLFIIGFLSSSVIHEKAKTRFFLTVLMFLTSIPITLLFNNQFFTILMLSFVHCLVFIRGRYYHVIAADKVLTPYLLWVLGFPVYFLAYFTYQYFGVLTPYIPVITWSGLIFIITTLFLSNSGVLKASTLAKNNKPIVSKAIKQKNSLYLLGMIGIVTLITSFGIVKYVIVQGFSLFISGLLWFLSFFESDEESIQQSPPATEQSFPVLERGEPSTIIVILEKIMYIAFYIIGTVICIMLIVYGGKKVMRLIKTSYQWLMNRVGQLLQLSNHNSENGLVYIDEKESLIDIKKLQKDTKEKVTKLFFKPFTQRRQKWENLTEREKVRYVYQQLVKEQILHHGYQYKRTNTSTETLTEIINEIDSMKPEVITLLDSYGKARYSNQMLSTQDLKNVRAIFELLKE
ncbi:hypothetical protein [Metabacillus malikii]|uniref:DUF4129 domain-containing protein n=1 Tax=Metabacillus malikii TaxID=1504265 RepID=A0ABT9ZEE9_9BACI|nr:hypothetical protein [Metabacillus malikii]MDQ0229953.1 hypothetical protein [Metabacillus malikii]